MFDVYEGKEWFFKCSTAAQHKHFFVCFLQLINHNFK